MLSRLLSCATRRLPPPPLVPHLRACSNSISAAQRFLAKELRDILEEERSRHTVETHHKQVVTDYLRCPFFKVHLQNGPEVILERMFRDERLLIRFMATVPPLHEQPLQFITDKMAENYQPHKNPNIEENLDKMADAMIADLKARHESFGSWRNAAEDFLGNEANEIDKRDWDRNVPFLATVTKTFRNRDPTLAFQCAAIDPYRGDPEYEKLKEKLKRKLERVKQRERRQKAITGGPNAPPAEDEYNSEDIEFDEDGGKGGDSYPARDSDDEAVGKHPGFKSKEEAVQFAEKTKSEIESTQPWVFGERLRVDNIRIFDNFKKAFPQSEEDERANLRHYLGRFPPMLPASYEDFFFDFMSERGIDVELSRFIISYSHVREGMLYESWLEKVSDFLRT